MVTSRFARATVAVAIVAFAVVGFQPAATAATPTRIMPLGDSITGSPGCWRAMLWNQLRAGGYTDIDFVGTMPAQNCGIAHDGQHEGHGGYLATNIANQNLLPGWLAATRPDIVLMHLGTNDVWNNIAPSTILAAYGRLVDQMRASNPDMRVLVAKIIPMNPAGCAACAQRVVALNAAIPGWASGKSTARSPITVVDQWTGFSTAADTYDGVHPVASGDQKMANRWYPALTRLLTTAGTSALYGFESGTESWTATGVAGGPWRTTEWAAQGAAGLKANVTLGANQRFTLARTAAHNLSSGSTLRATVRVAAWGGHGTGTVAKLYVKTGASWQWFEGTTATVGTGTAGTTLSLNLAGVTNRGDVREIGVLYTAAANSTGASAIYLDNVTTQ